MPDPRDTKIIDIVNHAVVNPCSFPPGKADYAPRTFISFAAAQPDHPLHGWDRQVIGDMLGAPPDGLEPPTQALGRPRSVH